MKWLLIYLLVSAVGSFLMGWFLSFINEKDKLDADH